MKRKLLPVIIGCALVTGLAMAQNRLEVTSFSENGLSGWEQKSFVGETEYKLVTENDSTVLLATSDSTASGLGKKIKIDLNKTPYLNWTWKINDKLEGLDETRKSGDDYVARLYVVKSGGALIWKTKALNYVWSSNQQQGATWKNAFQPKNAIMLAVRGKEDQSGQWVTEKRNVREDLKQAFGKNFDKIDAIAIMTDTDNSGAKASALYGDIFFSAE
jgi:hypothetical protein